jgi:anti-sigma regulatory factor (Ser/Thr protein kinase)
MAERGVSRGSESGPGNKRIATTFLESLAVRGQAAARERAMRALGLAEGGLANAKSRLPDDVLGRMFVAADTDSSLARSVGHRLMAPDATGISLYGLGLATPEKAYRRVQSLLPRESASSFWIVGEIASGSARIEYHDRPDADPGTAAERPGVGSGRGEASLCALRVGMLEAIPGLFGLLPASVNESSCLSDGADACRYEVSWERSSMVGLLTGSGAGLALFFGFLVAGFALAPPVLAVPTSVVCAVTSFGLAVVTGRMFDLHRQLEAVAGARRGHLALFDQVDDALASKLDALARADAKLEGDEFVSRADRSLVDSGDASLGAAPVRREVWSAAQKIHATAGDLECWFEEGAGDEIETKQGALNRGRELVREIRVWAAKITEDGASEDSFSRDSVDLVTLVARAIAAVRPALPPSTVINVDHDDDLRPIRCEPVQIEQVVVQLLRNAVEASCDLSESPEVFVSLRRVTRGIELAVEDRGVGIEPSLLDEVFDPFFGERRAGIDEGFGLPVCLRIVERHGGELRIEAEDRPGTRVSVLLPESPEAGP